MKDREIERTLETRVRTINEIDTILSGNFSIAAGCWRQTTPAVAYLNVRYYLLCAALICCAGILRDPRNRPGFREKADKSKHRGGRAGHDEGRRGALPQAVGEWYYHVYIHTLCKILCTVCTRQSGLSCAFFSQALGIYWVYMITRTKRGKDTYC